MTSNERNIMSDQNTVTDTVVDSFEAAGIDACFGGPVLWTQGPSTRYPLMRPFTLLTKTLTQTI